MNGPIRVAIAIATLILVNFDGCFILVHKFQMYNSCVGFAPVMIPLQGRAYQDISDGWQRTVCRTRLLQNALKMSSLPVAATRRTHVLHVPVRDRHAKPIAGPKLSPALRGESRFADESKLLLRLRGFLVLKSTMQSTPDSCPDLRNGIGLQPAADRSVQPIGALEAGRAALGLQRSSRKVS